MPENYENRCKPALVPSGGQVPHADASLRRYNAAMSRDARILQALAVPFRPQSSGGWEFCLITSLSKRRWGFPKGIIDPGETALQTALKEAQEEAGLWGEVIGEPLGAYDDFKWDSRLLVTGYLFRVHRVLDEWLEAGLRQRQWATADEARSLLANSKQLPLLETALARLASGQGGS